MNRSFVHRAKFEFRTPVYCLIADERVYRSKSPDMYNRVLANSELKGIYVPFMVEADKLGQAMEGLKVFNIAGANITVPYKEQVIPYLDILSEGAQIIGAVNTIVCKDGLLKGYNTNAIGFMDALNAAEFQVAGKKALVFGTGGMAKAVAFILNWLRADNVLVAGRNEKNLRILTDRINVEGISLKALSSRSIEVDLMVNATSISSPDESADLAALIHEIKVIGCKLMGLVLI